MALSKRARDRAVQISISLPMGVLEDIEYICEQTDTGRSAAIAKACREFIDRQAAKAQEAA